MRNKIIGAIRQTFSSLHNKNFRLYFMGQLVSNTGTWLTNVALTLLILHITDSGLAVGILATFQYGPILLLSVYGGTIADRSDKHKLLMITQFLEMLQSFSLALVAFLPHPKIGVLYAIAAAGGVMLAFDSPVRRSFVSEMVEKDDVANAVVLNTAVVTTSRIFGPALAGLLVVTTGYGWCFTIDGISYAFVLTALAMMNRKLLRPSPILPRAKGQIRAGFKYITQVPELWISFAMLALVGTLSYNFSVVFPLLVEHSLHGGDKEFTLVFATFSFGALIAALMAAHRQSVKVTQILYGATGMGVSMFVLAFVPNIYFVYPVVFFVGISSITFMTAVTAIVQVRADRQMHGRILALQAVLLIGTTPIGGPLMGYISDAFGARTAVGVGAVAALIAATAGFSALRRLEANNTMGKIKEGEMLNGVDLPTID